MNCLGFITASIVAIKSPPVAETGEVIVAKLVGEVSGSPPGTTSNVSRSLWRSPTPWAAIHQKHAKRAVVS